MSREDDAELELISKIIETQDLRTVLQSGVGYTALTGPVATEMLREITKYYHHKEHYGRVPSPRWMEQRFPGTFHIRKTQETLPELCVQVREEAMRLEIISLCDEILTEADDGDPEAALALMRSSVLKLQHMTPRSSDRLLSEDVEDIIERARLRRVGDTILGIPYPWEKLNEVTQGIQNEDFIIIFGRPKSMKSWVAAKIAAHAYAHANKRVLIYSCEMSTELFEDRVACTLMNLDYTKLKEGKLSDIDQAYYEAALRALPRDERIDTIGGRRRGIKFCSAYDDPNGGGVSHLMAKVEDFDADFVIVDALYKMKDDRTGKRSVRWEQQYNIVQDLSGVTATAHIPLIGVTQRARQRKESNNDDEQVEDVAYADAVGQEADVVYRIKKEGKATDGISTRLRVSMAASRETDVGGFILNVRLSTKWKLVSWLNEEGKVIKGDPDDGSPGEKKKQAPKSTLNPLRNQRKVDDNSPENESAGPTPSMKVEDVDTDFKVRK